MEEIVEYWRGPEYVLSSKDICQLVSADSGKEFEQDCYSKLISIALKPEYLEIPHIKKAVAFCSDMQVTYEKSCFDEIGKSLHATQISASKMAELCASIPNRYKNVCSNKYEAS